MKKRRQNNSVPGPQKYTVVDFNTEFPTDDACLNHIFYARWPDGITVCNSEKCGNVERRHHRVSGRTAYACDYCGKHIYPLVGTIFEKSTTPLKLWFYAMYLMGSTRCGISAKQLQREIGVTYKTAWRMFKQIRTLMAEDIVLDSGHVEMDETYVGGKRKNGRRGRPPAGDKKQTCVVGAVERKGRVVAIASTDATKKTLHDIAKERILPASTVYTDELSSYIGLDKIGYQHQRVNHSTGVYVVGDNHTNTVEGFWSLVKRGLSGVYHSVSKEYLQSYLNEYSYRYNRRHVMQPMFTSLLERASSLAK